MLVSLLPLQLLLCTTEVNCYCSPCSHGFVTSLSHCVLMTWMLAVPLLFCPSVLGWRWVSAHAACPAGNGWEGIRLSVTWRITNQLGDSHPQHCNRAGIDVTDQSTNQLGKWEVCQSRQSVVIVSATEVYVTIISCNQQLPKTIVSSKQNFAMVGCDLTALLSFLASCPRSVAWLIFVSLLLFRLPFTILSLRCMALVAPTPLAVKAGHLNERLPDFQDVIDLVKWPSGRQNQVNTSSVAANGNVT